MKPKPFASLNHFTVPCAMYLFLCRGQRPVLFPAGVDL
jgi:hypothetical protein